MSNTRTGTLLNRESAKSRCLSDRPVPMCRSNTVSYQCIAAAHSDVISGRVEADDGRRRHFF